MGEVAHPAQQPAGDARRAARAPRDLVGAVGRHADAEHARAAIDDELELGLGIEVEPHRDAETVAQRVGEEAGARCRPHQGELGEIDLHRTRRRPRPDDQVELKILHRGIEDFLHRRIEPVDLVDEQNVALLEIGQERREIARLRDHRTGGRAEIHPQFARHDLGERRLAQARRPDEQHMVERLVAGARRRDEHCEILSRLLLADELDQALRAQGGFRHILLAAFRGNERASRGCAHRFLTIARARGYTCWARAP